MIQMKLKAFYRAMEQKLVPQLLLAVIWTALLRLVLAILPNHSEITFFVLFICTSILFVVHQARFLDRN